MRIGLFIKYEVVDKSFEEEMIKKIKSFGHSFDNDNPEVVLSIGGDGTFLKAVQKYIDRINDVKFLCLNKGKLGFFSDYKVEDLDYILPRLATDEFVSHSFGLVSAEIQGKRIYAVNEIRVENPFHTFTCDVYVDDQYLETFRGNGLIVSTSLGSSGYNRSVGGALIDSRLEVLQLSEIAPISNCLYQSLKSPLVLAREAKVTFKGDLKEGLVGFDHLSIGLDSNEISVTLSNKRVNIINHKDRQYINKINKTFVERR